MPGRERGRILHAAQRLIRAHRAELAELESLDGGKPIAETPEADIDSGADCIEFFAGLAGTLNGEFADLGDDHLYTRREPIGFCAGIGAWNYAFQIACWKSAPALASGNAMVFKPAELTPASMTRSRARSSATSLTRARSALTAPGSSSRRASPSRSWSGSSLGSRGSASAPPLDSATQVGPLISAEQLERVMGYIEAGKREGARLRLGGGRPEDPALERGNYIEPTVFDRCTDDMSIVREEIFGPVMSVLSFAVEDEVLARANASAYGLAAGVFTRDLARAHRVAARLKAGVCWVNHYNVTPVEMPFAGTRLSGLGRENGRAGIEHYTELKSVYVGLGPVEAPY